MRKIIEPSSLTASRSLGRSIEERFTRSRIRLLSCFVYEHAHATDEMVCGTSKVHVVVDHGSGNSRPPAVVQVCMNVGHHLRRPPPPPSRGEQLREKTRNKKTSRDKFAFIRWIRVSFALTATGNSPVYPRVHPAEASCSPVPHYSECARERAMCSERVHELRGDR